MEFLRCLLQNRSSAFCHLPDPLRAMGLVAPSALSQKLFVSALAFQHSGVAKDRYHSLED